MKNRLFYLGFVCFTAAAVACAQSGDGGTEAGHNRVDPLKLGPVLGDLLPNESKIDFSGPITDDTPGCGGEVCFEVDSTKDLSFIAVDLGVCAGLDAKLTLYSFDKEGERVKVNIEPAPHGNGKSCLGIPPEALKFDGLSKKRYLVCVEASGVETPGAVQVFAKAGQTCATSEDYDEKCVPCDTGAGGSGGAGGAGQGGSGGSGGAGQGGSGGAGQGGSGSCEPPPCEQGLTRCAEACVDLSCDPYNCGSCGNACGPEEVCQYGTCVCPLQRCAGRARALQARGAVAPRPQRGVPPADEGARRKGKA